MNLNQKHLQTTKGKKRIVDESIRLSLLSEFEDLDSDFEKVQQLAGGSNKKKRRYREAPSKTETVTPLEISKVNKRIRDDSNEFGSIPTMLRSFTRTITIASTHSIDTSKTINNQTKPS